MRETPYGCNMIEAFRAGLVVLTTAWFPPRFPDGDLSARAGSSAVANSFEKSQGIRSVSGVDRGLHYGQPIRAFAMPVLPHMCETMSAQLLLEEEVCGGCSRAMRKALSKSSSLSISSKSGRLTSDTSARLAVCRPTPLVRAEARHRRRQRLFPLTSLKSR